MSASRRTPLHEVHESLGAKLIDFAGWQMPVWYSNAIDEHHAVRSAAGLFDLSHMAELFVTGTGAAEALDQALLLNASETAVGRARYTMICDERGGIIDDLIAYRLSDESFMIVANASNGDAVFGALTARCDAFDADVVNRTDEFALVAVQGPETEAIIDSVLGAELLALRYYRVAQMPILGQPAFAARTGYTGEDGFELFVPADIGKQLWATLSEAGANSGLVPVGLAARDTLRLEAGMPLYGNELTVETTPFDVGAARLFNDKPNGQVGAGALLEASQSPRWRLVGLEPTGRRPARSGYGIYRDGVNIGEITSGAPSPTLDKLIAIGRVDASAGAEVGDVVEIDVRSTMTEATVVELPFYRRPK